MKRATGQKNQADVILHLGKYALFLDTWEYSINKQWQKSDWQVLTQWRNYAGRVTFFDGRSGFSFPLSFGGGWLEFVTPVQHLDQEKVRAKHFRLILGAQKDAWLKNSFDFRFTWNYRFFFPITDRLIDWRPAQISDSVFHNMSPPQNFNKRTLLIVGAQKAKRISKRGFLKFYYVRIIILNL